MSSNPVNVSAISQSCNHRMMEKVQQEHRKKTKNDYDLATRSFRNVVCSNLCFYFINKHIDIHIYLLDIINQKVIPCSQSTFDIRN